VRYLESVACEFINRYLVELLFLPNCFSVPAAGKLLDNPRGFICTLYQRTLKFRRTRPKRQFYHRDWQRVGTPDRQMRALGQTLKPLPPPLVHLTVRSYRVIRQHPAIS